MVDAVKQMIEAFKDGLKEKYKDFISMDENWLSSCCGVSIELSLGGSIKRCSKCWKYLKNEDIIDRELEEVLANG